MAIAKSCAPTLEAPGGLAPEKASVIDPFLPAILDAAAADKALATYPGIEKALWIYQNAANGGSKELTEWADLAHQAQVSRGKARFQLPDTHVFRLEIPEATLILGKPIKRHGCQYVQETHLPIDNLEPQFGRTLSYGLHTPGPGRLTLLRLHIPGLQQPDGSYIRLGVDPEALQQEQISIIPHPGLGAIARASGQLLLAASYGE